MSATALPSSTPAYNYAEVLAYARSFYYGQMTGKQPSWQPLNWRGDSFLQDGADVGLDLTQSWSDCGDHVIFGLPLSYTSYMMGFILLEYETTLKATGEEYPKLLQQFDYIVDWWIRAHPSPNVLYGQVGLGNWDHTIWVPQEFGVQNRPSFQVNATHPGSDLAGNVATTFAFASMIHKSNATYSAQLLQHARDLFTFSTTYQGLYSTSIPDAAGFYCSSGYTDEQLLASLALYWATGESQYSTYAHANSRKLVGEYLIWTASWNDAEYLATYLLWQLMGDTDAQNTFTQWGQYWATKLQKTPGGLSWLTGWASLRYPIVSSFLMLAYLDNNPHTDPTMATIWNQYALQQINYVLGQNPLNRSYLTCYGNNPFTHLHHRGAHSSPNNDMFNPPNNRHCNFAMYGGPDLQDQIKDEITNYPQCEGGCNDMTVGLVGLAAALVKRYGGQAMLGFPPHETVGQEWQINATLALQSTTAYQVNTLLISTVSWPPRTVPVSFKYFVNITGLLQQGKNINSLALDSYYNENANIGPLQSWKNSSCIYYTEISWKKGVIYPGSTTSSRKAAQLSFHCNYNDNTCKLDPSYDWSYQGLNSANAVSHNIPIYENGKLVFGSEPSSIYCPNVSPSPSPTPTPSPQPSPFISYWQCQQCVAA